MIIVIICCKFTLFSFADDFGIKEPFPEDIYRIEGTETKVTCVAFDSLGVKTPERIQFMRRDIFSRYTNITASENVIFTERRESAVPPASELFLFAALYMYMYAFPYCAEVQVVI